jgi:HK97 family phage portal protein
VSLIKRGLEKRDYLGGFFSNPYGLPFGFIPSNGMTGFLDGVNGGIPVSNEQAMRHSTVYACVRIIADVISALPVEALQGAQGPNVKSLPIDPLPPKLQTPSAYTPRLNWIWQVMASLLLRGNAYGLISAYDRLGYPAQVDIIAPDHVRVQRNEKTGLKEFRIDNKTLTTDQVWHLPGPQMPGDLEGLSPIRFASRTIALGLEAEKFGTDYLRNGIHPSATLESDQVVGSEVANEVKKRVKEAQNNRDMVVLGAGLKMNQWSIHPDESQMLETLRHNGIMISQIFGVPPEMLGVSNRGASVTYANREQRAQDFLNTAINPWLARLEDALSAWFPRTTYVRFDTTELLRSDLLTRFQAYQTGIRNNFMLPSEVRATEDMPPIPGIDDKPLPSASGGANDSGGSSSGDSGAGNDSPPASK